MTQDDTPEPPDRSMADDHLSDFETPEEPDHLHAERREWIEHFMKRLEHQAPAVKPALDDPTDKPLDERATDLFHRWTVADLLAADREFHWNIRGMLVRPTYGMVGGEQKTLKSYVSTFIDLACATGTKLFGQFDIDNPGPVVSYVGEGGRIPFTRRLERIADAMGIHLPDADFHPTFDVAPVTSLIFEESLRRDLDELHPALVHIDPWYAYHGAQSEGKNLYAEGSLLSGLSQPCIDHGASLLVNHHFNQTGVSKGISRLTMAGAQEWVDSWILLAHRKDPDVDNGRFYLTMAIGSRQWGGSTWDLDIEVGRFDVDSAEYDGSITWDLNRASGGGKTSDRDAKVNILAAVMERPGELTKEQAAQAAGINLEKARALVAQLELEGQIHARSVPIVRSDGRSATSMRFFPTSDRTDESDVAAA